MADPRSTLNFEGIGSNYATFKTDNATIVFDATKIRGAATTMIDKAVSLSAAGTVQLTADGDAIEGRLESVESDNFCTVQFEGMTSLPGGLAAALTLGKKIVGATGAAGARGFVREVNTAVAAELGKADGEIIDASDASAVIVDL